MTDGEIAREYKLANDKAKQIKILSDQTLKPKEEIVRILKENGCEVEEKRRRQKPKAEEQDKKIGSARKRSCSSAIKEADQLRKEEREERLALQLAALSGVDFDTANNDVMKVVEKLQQVNGVRGCGDGGMRECPEEEGKKSSSGLPEGVRIALKKEAEYAGDMIRFCRERMEECYKVLVEIFEFADAVGISEKDLMR